LRRFIPIRAVYRYIMSEPDQQKVEEVKTFIDGKNKALTALKRAVKFEHENECTSCPFIDKDSHGISHWKPGNDVPMSPYYIGALKNSVVTNVLVDSNQHTLLSLDNIEAVEKAIDDIENQPEEHSKTWIEQEVESVNRPLCETIQQVEVTEEERNMIEDIVSENEALEYWYDYIAPDIKYREKAKKAILIMLASPKDKYGNKGRINVFMYGEPGTGKSLFKTFLKREFEAITIDGPRASKPDLTYNKKKEEMGKLPESHKGILVVEEADDMDEDVLGSTLTSFGETGRIEIRDMEIPAKARGVMLSNFESRQEIINQWSPESLNRFDFTIYFESLDDDKKSDTLDWHYEHFRKPNPNKNEDILKKYIKIVRGHTPDVAHSEKIMQYKDDHINKIGNIREGVSIMNIAWTIARLNLDDVKLKHYKKAFELTTSEKSLKDKFST